MWAAPVVIHDPRHPDAPGEVNGTLGADDGAYDVGAEYVSDSPPSGAGGSDLPICQTSAVNFYNKLRGNGFTGSDSYIYANSLVWETDYKRAALGGSENTYPDNVDIAYYCDHGFDGGVSFPWGHTDGSIVPGDCAGAWGDKDSEWLAFGTCQTLSDVGRAGWSNCMNGVHLLLGYTTISYDADEGGTWADQMLGSSISLPFLGTIWLRAPKSVAQAWFSMCDSVEPSSVQARVIGEDSRHFNDMIHGRGGPAYGDVVDNNYFWWDHNCYKPDPAKVDTAPLATLPAYQIRQRQVDEGYVQSIAATLGMSGTIASTGQGLALTDNSGGVTRTLEVQMASGGYLYQNLGRIWVAPEPGTPLGLPTEDQARALAEQFLNTNAQILPGAPYRTDHSETEKITGGGKGQTASLINDALQTSTSVDVMVAYGRRLDVPSGTNAQSGQTTQISIAGPGASSKVYFANAAGNKSLKVNQTNFPAGLAGGSRDVLPPTKSVAVQTADKAWSDFIADHQVAIIAVPLEADEITRDSTQDTLAYYEQPHSVHQDEMIPSWVFRATFKKAGAVLADNVLVYVPANVDYYPPSVTIDSPASGTTITPGSTVQLSATATGEFGPFTYQWTSSVSGNLGTEATVTARLAPAMRDGEVNPETISVKVTNGNGQSRTENVQVTVPAYNLSLPAIYKAPTGTAQ